MSRWLWFQIFATLGLTQLAGVAFGVTYTVGYLKPTFLRDPILYNYFSEHNSVSQILETLITSNTHGDIEPAIAEKWEVLDGGKTYRFYLRKNAYFSNGAPILAEDVKYSIVRHIDSKISQSSPFLQEIRELIVVGPRVVDIKLKKPRVTILKFLTRDQLGIVPNNWVFKEGIEEPFVASGPYRLKVLGKELYLEKNSYYFARENVPDIRWKVITTDEIGKNPFPDVVLSMTTGELQKTKSAKVDVSDHVVDQLISFSQISALWSPGGKDFKNDSMRKSKMRIMEDLLVEVAPIRSFLLATGIIPKGIAGYLNQRPRTVDAPLPFKKTEDVTIKTLKDLVDALPTSVVDSLQKKYNVHFIFQDYVPTDEKIPASDIVLMGWAGGFSDPEGFVPLISKILKQDLDTYLGNIPKVQHLYNQAIYEQDWTRRADIFRDFNKSLVESLYYVPGWRTNTFYAHRKNFEKSDISYRYSARVSDFRMKVQ